MSWLSLGGQWLDRSLWLLSGNDECKEFPPKPAVQHVLNKRAPGCEIRRHGGSSMQIVMPITTKLEAREAVIEDIRGLLVSHAA